MSDEIERLAWREGKPVERAVNCCNCGATIAIAEARVAGPKNNAIFSCSAACEQAFERDRQDAVKRLNRLVAEETASVGGHE